MVTVKINENIKEALAEKLLVVYELAHDPRIHSEFYTDGERVYEKFPNVNWNPWSDDVDDIVVPVQCVLDPDTTYYSWDEFDYYDLQAGIDEEYWEELKANEDYEDYGILEFLQEKHPQVYKDFMDNQREIAKEYFLREIQDEYYVEGE